MNVSVLSPPGTYRQRRTHSGGCPHIWTLEAGDRSFVLQESDVQKWYGRVLGFTCPLGFICMTSCDLCSILSKESSFCLQLFTSFSSRVIITRQQGGEPEPHSRVISWAMFADKRSQSAAGGVNEESDLKSGAGLPPDAAFIKKSSPRQHDWWELAPSHFSGISHGSASPNTAEVINTQPRRITLHVEWHHLLCINTLQSWSSSNKSVRGKSTNGSSFCSWFKQVFLFWKMARQCFQCHDVILCLYFFH